MGLYPVQGELKTLIRFTLEKPETKSRPYEECMNYLRSCLLVVMVTVCKISVLEEGITSYKIIRIPESRKNFLVNSKTLLFGIRNQVLGVRKQTFGIRKPLKWSLESSTWYPEFQDFHG